MPTPVRQRVQGLALAVARRTAAAEPGAERCAAEAGSTHL
jgi:hypothetical protein